MSGSRLSGEVKRIYGNHNHRFWKGVIGVLSILLAGAVFGLVRSEIKRAEDLGEVLKQMEGLRTTQVLMGQQADKSTTWIEDWSSVLKVPERDQRQDDNIEQHERRLTALERR